MVGRSGPGLRLAQASRVIWLRFGIEHCRLTFIVPMSGKYPENEQFYLLRRNS